MELYINSLTEAYELLNALKFLKSTELKSNTIDVLSIRLNATIAEVEAENE